MSQDLKKEIALKAKSGAGVTRRTILMTAVAGLGTVIAKRSVEAAEESGLPVEISTDQRRIVSELGERSHFETPRRLVGNLLPSSVSHTPLQDLNGFITPSDLHYESHNSGTVVKIVLPVGNGRS